MIEPSVSVPIEKPTSPAVVAEAGPADEPLEPILSSSTCQGLRVTPANHLPPCASAPIESFATSTAPASTQALDQSRVVIDYLIAIWLGAPGGANSLRGKEIFDAPRNSVQRATIFSGFDFAYRLRLPAASASSSVSVTTQLSFGPYFFNRARYIFVNSVEVIRRVLTSSLTESTTRMPTPLAALNLITSGLLNLNFAGLTLNLRPGSAG